MSRSVKYPNLVLSVIPHFDSGSYYAFFKVMVLAKVEGDDAMIGRVYAFELGGEFSDLMITGGTDRTQLADLENPIAEINVEWDSGFYHKEDLERGLAAMNDLEKGLTEIEKEVGPPASFGDYVARVARALGIGLIQVQETDGRPDRNLPLDEGRRRIDAIITDWKHQAREDRARTESKNSD